MDPQCSGYKMSHLLHRSLMGIQIWCLLQQDLIHQYVCLVRVYPIQKLLLHVIRIQPMSWVETPPDQDVLLWLRLYQEPRPRTIKVDTFRLTETYQIRMFWFSSPEGSTKAKKKNYQGRYTPVNGNLPCGQGTWHPTQQRSRPQTQNFSELLGGRDIP